MPMFADASSEAVPIHVLSKKTWADQTAGIADETLRFARTCGFEAKPGQHCLLPDPGGGLGAVLFGIHEPGTRGYDPFLPGKLATLLPAGTYAFVEDTPDIDLAALSWLLSGYRFTHFKAAKTEPATLRAPFAADAVRLERIAHGIFLARDLVNRPANDLGPDALEQAAIELAQRHGAVSRTIKGEKLARDFPLIHAVGQAAHEAPRLVELTFGPKSAPKVTLVGKGVTFDTGGLDLKPASAMALMKKDMAGAATAMALADMVMDAKLELNLRVLLPIVENAVSASAFRPGDIYRSRKGLTVEIGNTDAEGRLILADALALAVEDKPDLLMDFSTLTGAARVALGPDLPAFFTDDEDLAGSLARLGRHSHDPVWRLPLWPGYEPLVEGKAADLTNAPDSPFAGAITAALFLQKFVEPGMAWVHFDLYGWNPSAKPGRPEGGEAPTARLLYDLLCETAAS